MEKRNFIMEEFKIEDDLIQYDKCVKCGKNSPYPIDYPIDNRNFYIDNYGQLCIDCFRELQNKKMIK
jgi:hypothetical protein